MKKRHKLTGNLAEDVLAVHRNTDSAPKHSQTFYYMKGNQKCILLGEHKVQKSDLWEYSFIFKREEYIMFAKEEWYCTDMYLYLI